MNSLANAGSKMYEITREKFIKETGVFVSPLYFESICEYDFPEYMKEGLTLSEAIARWLDTYSIFITETEFSGKFRYIFEDDTICSMEIEKPTALDIIDWMAESNFDLLKRRDEMYTDRDSLIHICRNMIKTGEIFRDAFLLLSNKFKYEIANDNNLFDSLLLILGSNKIVKDSSITTEDEDKNT